MELAVVESAAAEALLFSRSAAIVGSLWAWWLAAMAAAVGLWRFRSAAVSKPAAGVAVATMSALPPPSTKADAAPAPALSPPSAEPDLGADAAARTEEALAFPHSQPPADRFRLEEDCFGTPKGRFTAYFNAEFGETDAAGRDDDEVDAADEKALGQGIDWQAAATEVRSRRTGDLGWYRYQDRSALNGSVVRLWDGDWRLTAAPAVARRRAPVRGKAGMCF